MTKERAARIFLIGIFVPLGTAMGAWVVDTFVLMVTSHSVPMASSTVAAVMASRHTSVTVYVTPRIAAVDHVLWAIFYASMAGFAVVLVLGVINAMVRRARGSAA